MKIVAFIAREVVPRAKRLDDALNRGQVLNEAGLGAGPIRDHH